LQLEKVSPVVNRPQVQAGFNLPEGPLHTPQVFVSNGNLVSIMLAVGAQHILPVKTGFFF